MVTTRCEYQQRRLIQSERERLGEKRKSRRRGDGERSRVRVGGEEEVRRGGEKKRWKGVEG